MLETNHPLQSICIRNTLTQFQVFEWTHIRDPDRIVDPSNELKPVRRQIEAVAGLKARTAR